MDTQDITNDATLWGHGEMQLRTDWFLLFENMFMHV